MTLDDRLQERLLALRALRYSAHSAVNDGWSGEGVGAVVVTQPEPGVVVFTESGTWKPEAGRETRFRNTFR